MHPFSIHRYADLDVYRLEALRIDTVGGIDKSILNVQARSSISYTLYYGDKPILCAGIIPYWSGTAGVWIAASDGINGKGLMVTKLLRHLLYNVVDKFLYTNLIAFVGSRDKSHERWARLFNFERVGVFSHAAIDGTDVIILEWRPK